ncbi:hypothetical protein STAWA0001_1617 [Staphylococcus warneri L37603]|nr:hypothetical protein STAWA0001_1617 [Staphylococcus warneri L37603]
MIPISKSFINFFKLALSLSIDSFKKAYSEKNGGTLLM